MPHQRAGLNEAKFKNKTLITCNLAPYLVSRELHSCIRVTFCTIITVTGCVVFRPSERNIAGKEKKGNFFFRSYDLYRVVAAHLQCG